MIWNEPIIIGKNNVKLKAEEIKIQKRSFIGIVPQIGKQGNRIFSKI